MSAPRSLKFILLQAAILLFCSVTHAQTNPGKIVYADDPGRIQIINADGTGQTKLTGGDGVICDDPVYSPDGSKIAFTRRSGFHSDIGMMNADGTNVVTVISGSGSPETHNFNPSWSPDGTKVVFSSSRSGPGKVEIWVANIDGTGLVRLTTNIQVSQDGQGPIFSSDTDPAWSPDGTRIAFASTREGIADTEIWIMNPDGSNPVRLTADDVDDRTPDWSPDSQRIAFAKSNGGGVHIMNRNGSNVVSVMPFAGWPAWSPDGSKLAFIESDANIGFKGAVFVSKTDGTQAVKVTNNPNGARAPSWAPSSSPPISTFTISGLVKDTNGVAISGATLTIFDIPIRTAQTDDSGAYSFTGLPTGTYRIDISKQGFGFTPPFTTLTNITANQTANFTAFVAFTISGQVTGAGSGLPINLSGSQTRSTFTEHDGTYSFTSVPAGGNYTVSINSPFFIVTPPSITFNNLQANQTANLAAVIATYTVSGTVRRLGVAKPGITMRLRDTSGNEPKSTITDANGHYEFTSVRAGGPYTVEHANANYLADSRGIAALDSNKVFDFDLRSANNIGFSRPSYTAVEGAANFQVTVLRGGNAAGVGPITVDYAVIDGTAKAGLDYTPVSGTLQFPEGSFSRTITIQIAENLVLQDPKQFTVVLSNATGEVDLVPPSSAVVTILDNEVRLITAANTDRAIALNAATLVTEPFTLTTEPNFSADPQTRISLFVEDLRVHQTFPTIVITATDAQQNQFQLPLEIVAFSSIRPFQQLIVRLPQNLSTGELTITVSVNGGLSNAARISIKSP
ncbi:MAG TPA: carboxypeptidase regulatory-like domain-containing protein [Pyrinomonadaceae bacterium]|nr:carboxypeptidase regulatory-like domain-containing protein [Pyrinomonadaceae bacterium]